MGARRGFVGAMAGDLPSHVVSAISFVGRTGGAVKTLAGFRKQQHSVPDAVNAFTLGFLAKICAPELGEQAEQLFQSIRTGLGYRRKEMSLAVSSPVATLNARDFVLELAYGFEGEDASRYRLTTTLRELNDVPMIRSEAFARVFARRFTEIQFAFAKGARVEAVIDAIEAIDDDAGLTVDYPSDCRECVIHVAGIDADVRCGGAALDVVFPHAGAPAELVDAFIAVRGAFQISKVLAGLIA